MQHLATAGRVLIGALFVMAGVGKFMHLDGNIQYAESVGLPLATLAVWGAATLEVAAGGALIAGFQARLAALGLAGFVALTLIFFHAFWTFEGAAATTQMTLFIKNVMIIGGLLVVAGLGAGPLSLDRRR